MKKLLLIGGVIIGMWAGQVGAAEITINSPGIVGIVNGDLPAGTPPETEILYAQKLLDMLKSSSINYDGTVGTQLQTSDTEYSGTLTYTEGSKVDGGSTAVPAGYEFVFGKYDGQNGGYILFYTGGAAFTLPQFSYSIWGANSGQYQLSHFTPFNSDNFSVPDGGTTLALLGLVMVGIGAFRKTLV